MTAKNLQILPPDDTIPDAFSHAHIARMQLVMRNMRNIIRSMEASKFWKIRNRWVAFRIKLGIISADPLPPFHMPLDLTELAEVDDQYFQWLQQHSLRSSDSERLSRLVTFFPHKPTISIVMPVYNVAEILLRGAIESVLAQIYSNWELCIADDASTLPHIKEVLYEYQERDKRIKVVFRETNGHISRCSNSAIELATGEFVAMLDHDDLLSADALFEVVALLNKHPDADVIYSDEDKISETGMRRDPYFKPDWSPDTLLSKNYIAHLAVYRRTLLARIQGFRVGFEGSQDYDLLLRATEQTTKIYHIPKVLYHWRIHEGSTAAREEAKTYAYDAAVKALEEALQRRGEPGEVKQLADPPGRYCVRYKIRNPGRVSLIIPTRDHADDVDRCLSSIFGNTTYPDYEVILVDNGSRESRTKACLTRWAACEPKRFRVVPYDAPFNYSKINNIAVTKSSGKYLLLLNNDTEVLSEDWMTAMVEQAQRPSIGAVGALLLFPDNTIQHAGVITRIGGVAGHSHRFLPADHRGYFDAVRTITNYSAVTGACLMVRREVFDEVGGLDEELAVALNDVDFCLKLRKAGYYNVFLPHVRLYHFESKTRGADDTPAKVARSRSEQALMQERWDIAKAEDPFYNPNLTLLHENYSLRV